VVDPNRGEFGACAGLEFPAAFKIDGCSQVPRGSKI
jgi:hypothetical protein